MEDVEIARNTKLKNIYEIAKILDIPEEDVEPYGKYKAKISLKLMEKEPMKLPVRENRWRLCRDRWK